MTAAWGWAVLLGEASPRPLAACSPAQGVARRRAQAAHFSPVAATSAACAVTLAASLSSMARYSWAARDVYCIVRRQQQARQEAERAVLAAAKRS